MKTYFKPVILMSDGGNGELFPPGSEGSVGGGDGGEWGTGGDSNNKSLTTSTGVDLSKSNPENTEGASNVSDTTALTDGQLGD